MSLFKTMVYIKREPVKTVYGGRKKQSAEKIIKSISNLFKLKRRIKQLKIEYLDISAPFLNKYMITINQQEWVIFGITIISNIKGGGDRKKNLLVKEYLDEIKPYLRHIIINLQNFDTWKNPLTIAINFIFSKDIDKVRVMHLKSDNIEFVKYDNANEVANEFFESLLS